MLELADQTAAGVAPGLVRKVEVVKFAYQVPNATRDAETGKLIACKGKSATLNSFAIRLDAGEVSGEYVAHMGGRPAIHEQVLAVAQGLVGTPVAAPSSFASKANKQLQTLGGLGTGALDIAMWDLLGKSLGVSVSCLIGRVRDRLPAYASLIHGAGDLTREAAFRDALQACLEAGFTGIKFRGRPGCGAEDYARTIQVSADELGHDRSVNLFLDPGCDLLRFSDALYVGRAADEAGLFWLEDMMRDGGQSLAAHRRLRSHIRTPLLCGEHVRGVEAKAEWVASGVADFIRADPELDGGITGCLKIAHLAEAFGMDVELHGSGPAHRIAMAAIRNTNFYELGLVLPDGTNIHAPPVYSDGYSDGYDAIGRDSALQVPTGPGLGVQYDWDKILASSSQRVVFS